MMVNPTKAYMFLPKQRKITKTNLIKQMKKNIDENYEKEEIKTY